MKNQYLPRALILIVLLAVFSYSRAWAADPLQTQMSMSGDMDVDVIKASILDNRCDEAGFLAGQLAR